MSLLLLILLMLLLLRLLASASADCCCCLELSALDLVLNNTRVDLSHVHNLILGATSSVDARCIPLLIPALAQNRKQRLQVFQEVTHLPPS